MNSKEFWDARYRDKPESWGENPNVFLGEIDLTGLSTAVDLAGGNGRNSLWLASQGLQVENVDISSVALDQFMDRAKKSGIEEKCQINNSDATSVTFGLSPDLLLIAYLQINAEGLSTALSNAFKQLKDGA
ncbi:MAG TPA: class I SAM-dependent methyltransferase, partial [Microbacteriaceae bacterium]